MTHNPINQYRTVDTSGHVETASPHKLIEMLYAGLKDALHGVHRAIEIGQIAAKAKALGKALDILQTLQMSLDPKAGGSIADNMAGLYEYMERRLTEANLHNDDKAIEEVLSLTESLQEAWATIPDNLRQGNVAA
jgi:flagellar protein FliS